MAAAALVVSQKKYGTRTRTRLEWTAATNGANTMTASAPTSGSFEPLTGWVVEVETYPTSGGTAPTDLYDLIVDNENTTDILAGAGANSSSTVGESIVATNGPGIIFLETSDLTMAVTNAGNGGDGTVDVYTDTETL